MLMFGMVLCDMLRLLYQRYFKKKMQKISLFSLFKNVLPLFSSVVVFMSTYLTSTAISPFNCVKVSNNTFVLWKNPSEICFRGSWAENIYFAVTFSIIYLVLVPLSILLVFIKYRKRIAEPQFLKKFGSLIDPYKPRYFYWELVMLVKRIAFISVREIILIGYDEQFKFILSILILSLFFALEIYFAPYCTENSNIQNIS
jgi:hypothetical protein